MLHSQYVLGWAAFIKQRQSEQRSKRLRPSYEEGELRDRGLEKLPDRSFQESDFPEAVRKAAATRYESPCNKFLLAPGVQTLPLKPSSG